MKVNIIKSPFVPFPDFTQDEISKRDCVAAGRYSCPSLISERTSAKVGTINTAKPIMIVKAAVKTTNGYNKFSDFLALSEVIILAMFACRDSIALGS